MDKEHTALAFLNNGGETGALMRAHDWSTSPLGEPASWSSALRTVVGLLVHSKFPMFVAWGPELGFLYNDAYAEILGDKHPAGLGGRFYDLWSEIWDDISPLIDRAMAGDASYRENLPLIVRRNGKDEQAWFTFSYSPVRDENNVVSGMYCAVTETTQQVRAEMNRTQEIERMRHLFEQAPGLMAFLHGPNHVFDLANAAYRQIVGRSELIGKPVREALPELVDQGFFALLDRVYDTGEPFVGREVRVMLQRQAADGLEERFVNFIYQPVKDHAGKVSGIFIEGSDVTEAVRVNNALRESEQRLRALANTIPQLAWIADADGTIHWYNDRWYDYTGTTPEQMQEHGWQSIPAPEVLPLAMEKWQTSLATGTPFEHTIPLRGANGEFRTFYTRAAPLRDAAGNIMQWFGTNTDVTPLEEAHNELRLASRRKDEFLAMLAHELRNPLAPISAAAELLRLGMTDGTRIRNTSDIISRQVSHMTKLIDDLLDVSRVTRGLVSLHKETLDINTIIANAVEQVHSLFAAKHQTLTLNVPDDALFVDGDQTRLIQVFTNILNNAAKYTQENGHIALHAIADDGLLEVRITDDGAGIAPALLPHIFDLFTQAERSPDRSQGGLGLGLALVKSLVELHGGSVTAHSDGPGKGSTFVLRLPRSAEADRVPRQPGKSKAANRTASPFQLMVVDDNPDITNTFSSLLQTFGHIVSVEHNGQRALEQARLHAPQMLFLDVGLPDMDGYELARRLRAMPETAHSVLVAVTGYGQPQDKALATQAGFDHYLVKPVQVAAVAKLLMTLE
jgi:PAS domain S-box-containing protein